MKQIDNGLVTLRCQEVFFFLKLISMFIQKKQCSYLDVLSKLIVIFVVIQVFAAFFFLVVN